jgi:hypothetical protein
MREHFGGIFVELFGGIEGDTLPTRGNSIHFLHPLQQMIDTRQRRQIDEREEENKWGEIK